MRKTILVFISLILLICLLPLSGCKPDMVEEETTVIDPKAIEVAEIFINSFWDSQYKYFFHNNTKKTDGIHLSGPGFGKYTDFWLEAQNWQTVMDIYELQGGETYRELIDKVFQGFSSFYPNYQSNDYNDDIGWWALGSTRAYSLTNDIFYLEKAKEMFDHIYESFSEELGGGIFWTKGKTEKNVCTNAPAVITAARLAGFLSEEEYLEKAISIFEWIKDNLYDAETGKLNDTVRLDSTIYEGQFSYNYGTFVGAAYELYLQTGDSAYLQYTEKPLDYILSQKIEDGIMIPEGQGDGAAFRTILFRTLNIFAKSSRPDYQVIINDNALATYNNRRISDSLCGYNWAEIPSDELIIMSVAYAASTSLFQFYKV